MQQILQNKYLQPIGSPVDGVTNAQVKQVPWEWGINQKIQAKQVRLSRANIKFPFQLSDQATGSGVIGNGTTLNFTTTLTPNAPHANEINFAIPYVAIYWNTAGIGTAQIWPQLGAGVPGTAFTVTAGFDWHLFSLGVPGSVIASFSGNITDNSMGNGTIQLVTQWEFINFNTGSMSSA